MKTCSLMQSIDEWSVCVSVNVRTVRLCIREYCNIVQMLILLYENKNKNQMEMS